MSALLATASGSGFSGVSSVPFGRMPFSIMRASTQVSVGLVASSNLPLYFAMYSFGAWCGAWFAPG